MKAPECTLDIGKFLQMYLWMDEWVVGWGWYTVGEWAGGRVSGRVDG